MFKDKNICLYKTAYDFLDGIVKRDARLHDVNNKLYSSNMTAFELYEATRGYWRVGKTNSDKVKYVLSVYSGMVLEVYEVAGWYDEMSTMMDSRAEETAFLYEDDYDEEEMQFDRREFVGRIALEEVRNKYIFKSVASFYANGKRNPIRYFLNGTDEGEKYSFRFLITQFMTDISA